MITRFHLKRSNGNKSGPPRHNSKSKSPTVGIRKSYSPLNASNPPPATSFKALTNPLKFDQLSALVNSQLPSPPTKPVIPSTPPFTVSPESPPTNLQPSPPVPHQLPSISELLNHTASVQTQSNTDKYSYSPYTALSSFDKGQDRWDIPHTQIMEKEKPIHSQAIVPTHQDECSLLDSFSFFFEETAYICENTLVKMQKNGYYHHCLQESYASPNETLANPPEIFSITKPEVCQAINATLFGNDVSLYLSAFQLSGHAKFSWDKLEHVTATIHRSSFNIQSRHTLLAAAIVFTGMVTVSSSKRNLDTIHRRVCETVRQALVLVEGSLETYDPMKVAANLDLYLSLGLLAWHNYSPIYSKKVSYNPLTSELHVCLDKYAQIGGVFHAKEDTQIYYSNDAIVNSDAYTFFLKTDPGDRYKQWRTWIAHESLIRVNHFLNAYEFSRKYVSQLPFEDSLTDSDIVMICCPSLWRANSPDMFFHTVGSQRSIATVSFLLLMKAMLRLSPIGDDGSTELTMNCKQGHASWTFSHLYIILSGLSTVGWIIEGCTYYQAKNTMRHRIPVINENEHSDRSDMSDSSDTSNSSPNVSLIDHQTQSRFFSALQMWSIFSSNVVAQYLERMDLHNVTAATSPSRIPEHLSYSCTTAGTLSGEVPWDTILTICLMYQNLYYSMFTIGDFETELVKNISQNIAGLQRMPVPSWTAQQTETFIMFGTLHPSNDAINALNVWSDTDVSYSLITLSGLFLMLVLNSRYPTCLGGPELVSARTMLPPALLTMWAWDYQKRMSRNDLFSVQYSDYYRTCIHEPVKANPYPLLAQHADYGRHIYETSRGGHVNPNEKGPIRLKNRVGFLYAYKPKNFAPLSVFSFLGVLSYMEEVHLNLDPGFPQSELLRNVKAGL